MPGRRNHDDGTDDEGAATARTGMRATPAETDARMHANGSTKPDAGYGGGSLVSTREDHTHVERSEAEVPAGSERGA